MITARAWKVGSATPDWQVSYSDSAASRIQSRGAVATWSYLQSANAIAAINTDNLAASAASGSTQPAPARRDHVRP